MEGLLWEEFEAGGSWRTGERRVTLEDLERFSEVSGDLNPLHLDDALARAAGYEGRIAQGVLGTAIATGLINRLGLTSGTLVALAGLSWRFAKPLYPGATVHVDLKVNSVRATRRADRGIVVLEAALADEAAVYQRGELTMLMRRQPGRGRAHSPST
jgi:acyl dehydratase